MRPTERLKYLWGKGWVKAVIIALPATALFSWIALLGFYAGFMGIVWTLDGTYGEWKSSVDYYDVRMMLQGLGGILGLLGAWITFLGQNRLQRSVSYLNWFVGFLLLSGVGSALWLVFMNGWASAYRSMTRTMNGFFVWGGLLILAGYGLYLAISLVRKEETAELDLPNR